jgi:outer membrane lipopolysaccharide assembly protein LptE/RlpB
MRAVRPFPLLLLAATAVFAGCGVYTLGTRAKPPFSTIALQPVENATHAPQVQAILHQQLADALSRENNIRLISQGDGAAATLRVRLTAYEHTLSATNPDDTMRGSAFTLTLRARCTLINNTTGKPHFAEREISASQVAHVPAAGATGSFSSVEYQTLPILTRELARKIRDALTDTW